MNDWNDFDNLPNDNDEDDDLDFDWFGDEDDDETGGLDWDAAADDVGLDWLDDSEKADDDSPIAGQARPSNMSEELMEQNLEAAEEAAFGDTGELLDWMGDGDEDTPEPEVPSWLEGMNVLDPDTDEVDTIKQDVDALYGNNLSDEEAQPAPDDEFDSFESLFGAAEDDSDEMQTEAADTFAALFGEGELVDDDDDEGVSFDSFLDSNAEDEEEYDTSFLDNVTVDGDDDDDDMSWFSGSLDSGEATGDFDAFVAGTPEEEAEDAGTDWFSETTDNVDDDMSEFIEKIATGQLNPDVVDNMSGGSSSDDVSSSFDWGLEDTGDDEPTEAATADWLADMDMPEPDTLDDAIGKMFTDTLGDDVDFESVPDAQAEAPDWLDEVEAPDDDLDFLLEGVEVGDDDLSDLLAELDTDTDADLDDLLAELGGDDDDDIDLDALLAEVDGDDAGDMDDLLAMLDEDEPVVEADDLSFLDELEAEPVDELEPADDLSFLDDMEAFEDEPVAEAEDLSFLDEMEMFEDEPLAEAEDLSFLDELEPADDHSFLDDIPEIEADTEPVADMADDLSFLDDMVDEVQADSWLDDIPSNIGEEDLELQQEVDLTASAAGVDIDELLDSFDPVQEESGPIKPADLSAVLAEMDLDAETRAELEEQINLGDGDVPDWLREAVTSSETGSTAAAILRQRQDRSLDDLDDRLLDLRERGLTIPSDNDSSHNAATIEGIMPRVGDAIAPSSLAATSSTLISDVVLTDEQRGRVDLMRSLVGTDADASTERTNQRGLARNIRPGRIIVSLILLVLVVTPFFFDELGIGGFGFGELPPREFAGGSQESLVFLTMQLQNQSNTVLIATEYGASAARELDTMTEAFVSHALSREANVVVVSSDPVGLLRADNILMDLTDGVGRNSDWYIAGYLPAGNLGLRDLVNSTNNVLRTDIRGDVTNLNIRSLDDFSTIILIADSGDTIRGWMEQVVPNTDTGIVIGSSQSAAPLARPYVTGANGVIGLLEGYADAVTYNNMAVAENNPSPTPSPTATATGTATNTPTATPTASNTPTPSVTPTASNTPLVSDTPTPTETFTPAPIEVAIIVGDNRSNVRSGAGSDFPVVGGVDPGDIVRVIGISQDEGWVNIELLDGTEGWIASFLVELDTRLESELSDDSLDGASAPRRRVYYGKPPVFQQTGDGDAPAEPLNIEDKRVLPQELTDVSERWTAYSLGITGAIVIIALGNLFWIIRAIVRRGR